MSQQQNRIGAQIDESLAAHDTGDDLRHLFVDERFAAGDGNDWRAALVDCMQSVGDAHAPLQHLFRIVDLAAPGTGKIALEQGLQHQHQRVAPLTAQPARDHVASDTVHLMQRYSHVRYPNASTSARCSPQMRSHSSRNHGVKFALSGPAISACSASGLIQRQALISAGLMVTRSLARPMKTEHSSFSAAAELNCAWYWNLKRKCSAQLRPSSSCRRRRAATSMLSFRRG